MFGSSSGMEGWMAREPITALVMGPGRWEWSSLTRVRDHWSVAGKGVLDFPPGTADDPAERIRRLRAAVPGGIGRLVLGVPSDQMLLRVIRIPVTADDELPGVVRLQVDKFSPFPADTMSIAYEVLQRGAGESVVLIAGARDEDLNAFAGPLRTAGLTPDRLDLNLLAWWHVYRLSGKPQPAGRQVFLHLSDSQVEMVIQEDGVPVVFRRLDVVASGEPDPWVDDLVQDIQHILLSIELERGATGRLSAVVWTDAEVPALESRLKDLFPHGVQWEKGDEQSTVSQGLALRAVEPAAVSMDLTPPAWRTAGEQVLFRRRMILASVAVVVVWLGLLVGPYGGVWLQRALLKQLETRHAAVRDPALEVRNIRRLVSVIRRYLDNRFSSLECLREVSERMPAGVSLGQFIYRKGESLRLSGDAQTVEQVYDFKRSLDASEWLRESSLTGPSYDARKKLHTFEIDILLPGEAE